MNSNLLTRYRPSLKKFFKDLYIEFIDGGCSTRAAALAFTTLFSLVPLMTVSFTILSAFPVFHQWSQKVQDFIFANFVTGSAMVVKNYIQQFVEQTSQLSMAGLLFLIIAAIVMVFNMEVAFNNIWQVKKHRHGVQAFLLYWAVLTLLPVLIGAGLALTAYLNSLSIMVRLTQLLGLKEPILNYFSYFLTFFAFLGLYIGVPNCKVPFKPAVVGSIVATILFELAKYGFSIYIRFFPTYQLLYGALATIPIFFIWVYLSWLIILFGAVISHILTLRSQKAQQGRDDEQIVSSQ